MNGVVDLSTKVNRIIRFEMHCLSFGLLKRGRYAKRAGVFPSLYL